MKQKYAITVADVQINVVTEAEPSQVEAIVSSLDRKIRDISQRNRSCSKTDAAILCALDYCSERTQILEDKKAAENEAQDAVAARDAIRVKMQEMAEQIEKLENENAQLKKLLENTASGASVADVEEENDEPRVLDQVEEAKKDKNGGKNRVGSMFDLLTFGDI